MFFLPNDDLGIAITFVNADVKHAHELAVIYRIIEDYLYLDRTQSDRILDMINHPASDPRPDYSLLGSRQTTDPTRTSPPLRLEA